MHVPDGFFNAATSAGAGMVTAGALVPSLRSAAREMTERLTPLAGLVSAFVFALQMLNFPVGAGTSGHLLGGALAAVLVGPWLAVLCIAVVLLVQALVFADGGLTAYGLNVVLVGVVPAFAGFGTFRAVTRLLPRTAPAAVAGAAVAAAVSVPVAAAMFAVLFQIGGSVDIAFGPLLTAMVGVHIVIGLGEAAITGAVVSTVAAVRPDLISAAPWLRPVLRVHDGPPADGVPAGRRPVPIGLAGLAVAAVLVAFVAPRASTAPDGLEKVAGDHGFAAAGVDRTPIAGSLGPSSGADDALLPGAALVGAVVALTGSAAMTIASSRRRRPRTEETAGHRLPAEHGAAR